MKKAVSKVRARKARSRQKRAERNAGPVSVREHPALGAAIALLLWAATVGVLAIDLFGHAVTMPTIMPVVADAAFILVGLFTCGLLMQIVKPGLLRDNTRVALLSLIALLAIVCARAILYGAEIFGWPERDVVWFLLPFAMAPLMATIMLGGTVAAPLGFWVALVMAVIAGRSLPIFVTGAVATVMTMATAARVRTRSKVVRIGLVIGLTEIACVFGYTALNFRDTDAMLVIHQASACLASGLLSAFLALLIIPALESLFHITTNITLLELSDLGHPLLQRLAIEAPGTYHHSLVVANLAQAAADEIGANSLLARVSSYFHDIGKLTKPDFFSENIQMRRNPHDELQPSMSTLVITSHVKEGLSIAMLHKLPRPIMQIIREHHGTTLLTFFHHKARNQVESEPEHSARQSSNGKSTVDEGSFRYEGPRPSTRESAIVCLADAVEAASRSMEKTTPSHIEGVVNDLVYARIEDGQLDDCDLTMSELRQVRRCFVFTLTNMLHGRIPYPKNENGPKEQAKPGQAGPAEDKEAGTAAADAGQPSES